MESGRRLDDPHAEGYLEVFDYDLYFREFGSGDEVLLLLHGGPGNPHDLLAPLFDAAGSDLRVFAYDQYATGRTDGPQEGDFTRFTVDHFRAELREVVRQVDADRLHLYGHSWGGMLALEYALAHGETVDSLVVSNATADMPDHRDRVRETVRQLPDELAERMRRYEEQNRYFADEYREVVEELYARHSVRMDEMPKLLRASVENENTALYGHMWGPNEFAIPETSRLADWSVTDRLGEIEVPTLAIAGRHDHFDVSLVSNIVDGVPDGELVVMEESGHLPMWDEPERYVERVGTFVERV